MTSELKAVLDEIDAAVREAKPKLFDKLNPPAAAEQLSDLLAALGELPDDIAQWFAWHAGSCDGFLPYTSVGLIEPGEAATEIAFLRANPPSLSMPEPFCPLLTDRGGGLWIWVAEQPAKLWQYDRGEITKVEPFIEALRRMRDRWLDEKSIVRLEFVRISRLTTGSQQVELPLKAKKRTLALLKSLAPKQSVLFAQYSPCMRIRCSEQPGWNDSDGLLCIDMSRDGLAEMVAALDRDNSTPIPGVQRAQICFARQ